MIQEIAAKAQTTTLTNGTAKTCTSFLQGTNYLGQSGTITYESDGGSNAPFVQHHIQAERALGRVVVLDAGYARIHLAR